MTYNQLLQNFSLKLRVLRKKNKLTQMDMYVKHGFAYRWYQRMESGRCAPSMESLYNLAKVFNVAPADLLK